MHNSLTNKKLFFKLKYLFVLLLVTTVVANGLFFWLSKTQFINIDRINDITYISETDYQNLSLTEKQHLVEKYKSLFYFFDYDESHDYQSTFESIVNEYQSSLKLFKDAFIGLLIIAFLAYIIKTNTNLTKLRDTWLNCYSWHIWLILFLLVLATFLSIQKFSSLMVMLSGIRSLYFIVIAVLLITLKFVNLNKLMEVVASAFVLITIIQFPFVVIEYLFSTEIFNGSSILSTQHDRVVGTFNQPSSLAIFTVMSLIVRWETYATKKFKPIFCVLTLLVLFYVLSAASSMAILLFILFSGYLFAQYTINALEIHFCKRQLLLIVILFIVIFVISHFLISSVREDYLDSVWFRVFKYYQYMQSVPFSTLLFGQGLGSGTNTAYQFATQVSAQITNLAHIDHSFDYQSGFFIADSMLLTLISQVGIIATIIIYSCLSYGIVFIKRYRISFIMTVIASFSTNINELFPFYLMLALLLCVAYKNFIESSK